MKSNHPFIRKAKELGWTPIQEKSRAFPKGEFNKEVFVKTYILMRHDVGIMRGTAEIYVKIGHRLTFISNSSSCLSLPLYKIATYNFSLGKNKQ